MPQYWLMKSEPDCFSIDDLITAPQQITAWDGVRNFQARNFMRDAMQLGDGVLFYHSNCKPPAIVGCAEVVREGYPDHTAYDPHSEHPDLSSTPEKPKWYMVDIQFREKFSYPLSLEVLRQYPALENMLLLRKGNRLSVLPVSQSEWNFILQLAHQRGLYVK